jgi:hypothetical protein
VKAGAADEAYILARLTSYFPRITGYGYLKGYFRNVDEGVNYTMFFMSNDQGVLSFIYLADKDELPPTNATVTTTNPPSSSTATTINPATTPSSPVVPVTPSPPNLNVTKDNPKTNTNPAPVVTPTIDSSVTNKAATHHQTVPDPSSPHTNSSNK